MYRVLYRVLFECTIFWVHFKTSIRGRPQNPPVGRVDYSQPNPTAPSPLSNLWTRPSSFAEIIGGCGQLNIFVDLVTPFRHLNNIGGYFSP